MVIHIVIAGHEGHLRVLAANDALVACLYMIEISSMKEERRMEERETYVIDLFITHIQSTTI